MTSLRLATWQPIALAALSDLANGRPPGPGAAGLPDFALTALETLQVDGLVDHGNGRTPLQRVYDRVWQLQRSAACEIAAEGARRGFAPVIFKGADYIERYFSGRSPSIMGDIDVLVERAAIGAARASLYQLGYRQAKFDVTQRCLVDADVAAIAAVEAVHYELYPFCRLVPIELDAAERHAAHSWASKLPLWIPEDGAAWLCVELDLHHGIALDVEVAPLLEHCRPSPFDGARSFCPADSVWFTTSRLYTEVALHGKTTLRDFAYLVALLRDEQVDWDILLSACEQYQLRPALYYYLSFVNQLFDRRPVPDEVLDELDPRRGWRLRDWGWQLARIFDEIGPMPGWARGGDQTLATRCALFSTET